MPTILAIDTTAAFGSLALLSGGNLREEILLHSPDGFAHVVFTHIAALLKRNDCPLASIDAFAAASGPGSFTGVRVGLAAAKSLAESFHRPLIAVSNLQALAALGSAPLRAAVLDARRGQIFGAVYDAGLNPVVPETVAPFHHWIAAVPHTGVEFVAQDFSPFRPALAGTAHAAAPVLDGCRALAASIARLAAARLERGDAPDPASADANYVRQSDAELFWRDA